MSVKSPTEIRLSCVHSYPVYLLQMALIKNIYTFHWSRMCFEQSLQVSLLCLSVAIQPTDTPKFVTGADVDHWADVMQLQPDFKEPVTTVSYFTSSCYNIFVFTTAPYIHDSILRERKRWRLFHCKQHRNFLRSDILQQRLWRVCMYHQWLHEASENLCQIISYLVKPIRI
jgi:hypothetical protein